MMFWMPGPMMATIAMASRMPGNANMTSQQRMMNESTTPPKKPAIRPKMTPMAVPRMDAESAVPKDSCVPARMRLKTSRPNSSVPQTCLAVGPERTAE